MFRAFSFKASLLTFIVLSMALSAFLYSKVDDISLPSLHSIVVPLSTSKLKIQEEKPLPSDFTEDPAPKDIIVEDTLPAPVIDKPKAVIALIIYDYGLSKQMSENIFDTNIKNLTLSLSPYSDAPSKWIETAYEFSAEPWMSLYVTAKKEKDYGPLTILEGEQKEQNEKRFSLTLEQSSGGKGIIAYYDGLHSIIELSNIYKNLQKKNVPLTLFSQRPFFPKEDVMHAPDILSYNQTSKEIREFLNTLKRKALHDGVAFGAIPPNDLTLTLLSKWHAELLNESVKIVPLSTLRDYL